MEEELYESGNLKRRVWETAEEIRTETYEDTPLKTRINQIWYLNTDPISPPIGRKGDLPAVTLYHPSGRVKLEDFYLNGERGRIGHKPSVLEYADNEEHRIVGRMWYVDGKLNRERDLPAVVENFDNDEYRISFQAWYRDGKLHREGDEPAAIAYHDVLFSPEEIQKWYRDNQLYREGDEPAIMEFTVTGQLLKETYYEDGEIGRSSGPAVVTYYEDEDEGTVESQRWIPPRGSDPSLINYYPTGQVQRKVWMMETNIIGRKGIMPSIQTFHPNGKPMTMVWYTGGKIGFDGREGDTDFPAKIKYDENGAVVSNVWYMGGKPGRGEDKPSVVDMDGEAIVKEMWYLNGMVGREGGKPAVVTYYEDRHPQKVIKSESWYMEGVPGREGDLPIWIKYFDFVTPIVMTEMWKEPREGGGPTRVDYYRDEKKVKEEFWTDGGAPGRIGDLPTQIRYHESGNKDYETWNDSNGVRNRSTGPAMIVYFDDADGRVFSEEWFVRGKRQRTGDNPAVIKYFNTPEHPLMMEEWYYYDELHRENGPALIEYNEAGERLNVEFYINGEEIEQRDKPRDYPDSETCSETLKPLASNSQDMRTVLSGLMESCKATEAPVDEAYLDKIRNRLYLQFGMQQNLVRINTEQGKELLNSVKSRTKLLIHQDDLNVYYVGEEGVDAGGLRRQFVTNALKTAKNVLFNQMSVKSDLVGVVPRMYISRASDEDILREIGGINVFNLYETTGALFAHAILNNMNTDIPLSRYILWLMTMKQPPADSLLYYLLDTAETVDSKLGKLPEDMVEEYEEYLRETASEEYRGISDVSLRRLKAFLKGANPLTNVFQQMNVTPSELFALSYRTISEEEFRKFLEERVVYKRNGDPQRPIEGDQKKMLVDLFMGVKDKNYTQLLTYWCGQSSIKEGANYTVNVSDTMEAPKPGTCFCLLDLPSIFLSVDPDKEELRRGLVELFQTDLIYQTTFTRA